MGNDVSRQQRPPLPLAPLPRPVGLRHGSSLTFPHEITLKLEEQVGWSGDTFLVHDVNGQPCFKIQGKAASLSQRKILQDVNGRAIVCIRNEFAFGKKYGVYLGTGDNKDALLATIKAHSFLGVSVDISFTNVDGREMHLVLQGNFFANEATVSLPSGQIFCRISRHRWNANDLFFNNQTYYVTVAPGGDLALAMCICVALDEAKHDQQRSY